MIKKLLSGLFKNQQRNSWLVVIDLNDKIQPIDRGLTYEDPLDVFLKEKAFGEVVGGGTYQEKTGEIASCDLRLELSDWGMKQENIKQIIEKVEELGAPMGSKLTIDNTSQEIAFGRLEGIAIYLDGVNLPDEVYANCDINHLIEQLNSRLNYTGIACRNWQGAEFTSLYYYGESYDAMQEAISDILLSYPLCQGCKINKIA